MPVGGGSGDVFCDHGWFCENALSAASSRLAAVKSAVGSNLRLIRILAVIWIYEILHAAFLKSRLTLFYFNDLCAENSHHSPHGRMRLGVCEQFLLGRIVTQLWQRKILLFRNDVGDHVRDIPSGCDCSSVV